MVEFIELKEKGPTETGPTQICSKVERKPQN